MSGPRRSTSATSEYTVVSFDAVHTAPVAKGSKRVVNIGGVARLIDDNSHQLHDWQHVVATAARAERGQLGRQLQPPIGVEIVFRFAMPRSRPAAMRRHGIAWRTRRPDVDKLLRAVLDGITAGGLWGDDSHAAHIVVDKREIVDDWCGVECDLWEMSPL